MWFLYVPTIVNLSITSVLSLLAKNFLQLPVYFIAVTYVALRTLRYVRCVTLPFGTVAGHDITLYNHVT